MNQRKEPVERLRDGIKRLLCTGDDGAVARPQFSSRQPTSSVPNLALIPIVNCRLLAGRSDLWAWETASRAFNEKRRHVWMSQSAF